MDSMNNIENLSTPKKDSQKPTNDRWQRAFFVLLAVFSCLVLIGGSAFAGWFLASQGGVRFPTEITTSDFDGNTQITEGEASIASVVDKVSPSVVSITTSTEVRSMFGSSSQQGAGTGVIVSKNGYVMTNNHVVQGSSSVSVIDSDGNLYDNVKIVGRDPLNDIAFLKITSDKTFTPAVIGDSSTVRIGQQVIAIGNALGQYKNTVTSGILSGKGRPVTASDGRGSTEALTDLLQTDAGINSGNSGGPLLNMAGQVIGINTAVASNANGIGFAIPINSTKGILSEVLETGKVKRAYIGVNFMDITPDIARKYNLSTQRGAFIHNERGTAVINGGPADRAGIKDGDVIQKVNDSIIGEHGGFSSIIGQYRAGDKVALSILRDGSTITKELTLGDYSD